MNQPPAIHLLASDVAFQHARCGLVLVDPHGERMTTDRARVTCRQCRRVAHLDWSRPVVWPRGEEQGQ